MSWYIRVIDRPTEEPLSLAEAKIHLHVDHTDEDEMISGYISSARELIEEECSRALMTQTVELGLDDFPRYEDRIRIPRGQLQGIFSFSYTDVDGITHAMNAGTDYKLNQFSEPAELVLPFNAVWPSVMLDTAAPVRIQFQCGYESAATVPWQAKHAIRMLIGDWYVNREDVVIGRTSTVAAKLPNGVDRLLTNLRLRNYTPYSR